jgi:CheY-like chemotaxis protein
VYLIVRAVQFFVFLFSFGVVYHIYNVKNTSKQRMLLLAAICAVINMYGYLEALTTMTEQTSKWSVRSQYVSAVLFLVFMLHLIAMFCDYTIKKWQSRTLWAVNAVFVILLFIDENVNLMFHNYSFEERFLAVQIRFDLKPLGYVFMVYVACLAIAVLYVGIIVRQAKRRDLVISIIAFSTVLPMIAYMLDLAGLTAGFDLGPTLMILSCWLVYHFDGSYHLLDDGQVAKETILDELGEGYIILNSERGVKSYNSIAAMLYPELEQPGEREVVVELIYLHNHDVLEHNGKICNVVISELRENGDLTGYIMWLYDCTDEYNYMKNLEHIQEQASVSDKTRNLFLNHMTHGFGSPLHIMENRADAIYQDERSSEDVREMALEILEESRKLEDMVSIILDYSVQNQHRHQNRDVEYRTKTLMDDLRSMLEKRRQGNCQQLLLTASEQLPVRWYGDRAGIESVANGVLLLAGIAARVTGIEINLDSEMRYADALLIVTVYLNDNGGTTGEINRLSNLAQLPGRKAESEVHYIPYSMFRRQLLELKGTMECSVDMSRSKISLMIPQRIADNTPYDAQKAAEEPVEEAPAEDSENAAVSVEQTEAVTVPQPRIQPQAETPVVEERRFTVLVVDDNLLYLKEMDNWLRKLNLKTIMAKSGKECLKILERKPVDLIFMDQMMPEMDGTQALKGIRKLEQQTDRARVPVVVLTADDSAGAKQRYLDLGFDDYLAKPIESQQIQEQVNRYLHI